MISKLLEYLGQQNGQGGMLSQDSNMPAPIDPRTQAMRQQGMLGAVGSLLDTSGYTRMPVSTGQRLGAALQGYTQGANNKAPLELQSANIDAMSKGNVLATQVISAATATGNQGAYDRAKQQLQKSGIDLSAWAPDVKTAAQQAQAARLAQSPLGSLLNAGLKQDSNNIALAGLTGTLPGGSATTNLGGGINLPSFLSGNQNQQPGAQGQPNPVAIQPSTQPGQTPAEGAAALLDAKFPAQAGTTSEIPATPQFVAPIRNSTETQAAYQQRYQQALEAYKANPDVMAANKQAETAAGKTGEAIGEAGKTLHIMQSNLPMVIQRFENMRQASMKAGYGIGNDNEGSGFMQEFHNNFENSPTAEANQTLRQYAAQGILPELGPQLAQAGIRGNKFLETIASTASGLDMSANPASKLKLINGLENTYINNLKATAIQLKANGKPAPTNDEINAYVKKIKSEGMGGAPSATPASQNTQAVDYSEFFK